jgi:hypothetical protein
MEGSTGQKVAMPWLSSSVCGALTMCLLTERTPAHRNLDTSKHPILFVLFRNKNPGSCLRHLTPAD